jgi:transcriptional regulator EpsA
MRPNKSSDDAPRQSARNSFQLFDEDTQRYLRIVAQSQAIKRHVDLFVWLKGEFQEFVPHEIFISAWGDFENLDLKLDIVSGLPGVRTELLRRHRIDDLIQWAHARWVEGGRAPLMLKTSSAPQLIDVGANPLYASLREMDSILLHGIRDERGGRESLYLAATKGSFTKGRCRDRFIALADSLVPQIDIAFRKVSAYPLGTVKRRDGVIMGVKTSANGRELSTREHEILGWICQGKTNTEIAATLRISPFTVKNHVQRIFKKIGVTSRIQAATKYSHSLAELREYLELVRKVD